MAKLQTKITPKAKRLVDNLVSASQRYGLAMGRNQQTFFKSDSDTHRLNLEAFILDLQIQVKKAYASR